MNDMMQYKGYYGSVHFDRAELIFYGKVEFTRALVSYEAMDALRLHKAFKEAVNAYLAICKEQRGV